MNTKLTELYRKHREAVLYLVFGGLTTAINYIVYAGCFLILPVVATTIPNLIAWVVSVLFAYLTNRTWVFHSRAKGAGPITREISAFTGARVFTLVLETLLLRLTVDVLGWPNLILKLLVNVLVIVLNYLFSKLWIFKKNSDE